VKAGAAVNWLDAVLILVLAFSVWRSFAKGLTREVVGLLSVIVGIFLGSWLYSTAAEWIEPYVHTRATANFCGFLIVVLGVMLLGSLVGFILSKLLRVTGLSFFDRLLGAAFGIVRGVLMAAALVMAILAFAPGVQADTLPEAVAASRLAPLVIGAARVFVAAAPREIKDGFRKSYDQVKSRWEDGLRKGIRKVRKEANHEGEI
jgi:membrane protein required for colicin V production